MVNDVKMKGFMSKDQIHGPVKKAWLKDEVADGTVNLLLRLQNDHRCDLRMQYSSVRWKSL